MNKPTDYWAIQAWGNMLGSMQYFIVNQQRRAAESNAPLDTIYFDNKGEPVRADSIVNADMRKRIMAEKPHG